jgi:ribonuclease HIII
MAKTKIHKEEYSLTPPLMAELKNANSLKGFSHKQVLFSLRHNWLWHKNQAVVFNRLIFIFFYL